MKKIIFLFSMIYCLSLIGLIAQDTTKIVIVHSNDMHSKIDNMAKVAYQIEKIKAENENVFVFSAGDLFTGNPIVDKFKQPGYPIVDLMNLLEYDLTCIGNHEFDYGQKILKQRISQAQFSFICANVNAENAIINQPEPFARFFTKDSISIGVLGFIQLNNNGLPSTNPANLKNLKFTKTLDTLSSFQHYSDSADILLALTHLGYKTDVKVAQNYNFFDAIIGGHSHSLLPNGEIVYGTLVTQAGSYYQTIGVLTILFSNNQVISVTDSIVYIDKISEYSEKISNKIDKYNNNPYFNTVIGVAQDTIKGNQQLGALMTDAIIDSLDVDIAFQNIGGIRINQIPKGNITIKYVLELSPFANTYMIFELTKKQIKNLIEYAYSIHKANELQVSGIYFTLILDNNNNLKKVTLEDYNGNVLKNKKYRVAVNNYMALSYKLDFLKNGKDTKVEDAGCTINFIKKKKTINYSGTKRVFVKQN